MLYICQSHLLIKILLDFMHLFIKKKKKSNCPLYNSAGEEYE